MGGFWQQQTTSVLFAHFYMELSCDSSVCDQAVSKTGTVDISQSFSEVMAPFVSVSRTNLSVNAR